ncbi:hypothetical protein KGM_204408 [Danaus plexippus plexippus]|uniref:Uncharacterized protein n=1 Tax=Danaus plexippus plexippus TaxID=278856 RepID=A0A212F3X4_DANPL|nr:hypothetical protein KGM_204408 [Danaus plexippus plexippus]
MWRRRWRYAPIAVLLILITRDTQCQDENDFYYTPDRSFAQVQQPIFSNSRPTTFYDNRDSFRVGQTVQPTPYNDGRIRFPSPNYNQNPSPFQLPTGRSQSSSPYYINQADVSTSQRQRFRPALPYNFQLVHQHPASTKRPDLSQIHSVAYQNDPSKPETFLGQITINNPDIDYLQNNRFKNIPFDGNSLKSNGQSGHIPHDDEMDNDDHDIFDNHKVTTYNPTKTESRQKINVKPNTLRFSHFDKIPGIEVKKTVQNIPLNEHGENNNFKPLKNIPNLYQGSSTEYKSLLDIEPLLEDDISDISSFRQLMKNNEGSFDVQVIKSNKSKDSYDSRPDASSMSAQNLADNSAVKAKPIESSTISSKTQAANNFNVTKVHDHDTNDEDINEEEEEVGEEYVEYYDDEESDVKHTTAKPITSTRSEPITDIYDEYDSSEDSEKPKDEVKINNTNTFEVLVMKPNKTLVKDDNFKQFVDTTVIDQTNSASDNDTTAPSLKFTFSKEDVSSIEPPSILGQEVVSVVTTKSVVNGTISIPDVTYPPTPKSKTVTPALNIENNDTSPVTTESWIVVASVQTSRSVSGARFLPFPAVEQEEKKQVLAEDEESVTENPKQDLSSVANSPSSTENINDKLDSIQSELSSAVLSGNLKNDNKNIELITETTPEPIRTTTVAHKINVFTLKSTQPFAITERSFPEPLPVQIKKFVPRVTSTTTPKPKKKLVTIMDDLSGLLPSGYKSRQSYKEKRTSTTSTTTTTTSTTTTTTSLPSTASTENLIINGTQGRSSGISSKNKVIILDDKSLLPKEYKPKPRVPEISFNKNQDDISKFLPPGYKLESNLDNNEDTMNTSKLDTFKNVHEVDISSFLPKGYKLNSTSSTTTTEKPKPLSNIQVHTSDINAFLPPGYNINSTETENNDSPLTKFKIVDVKNFLPPDFQPNNSEENETTSTTTSPGKFKLVFPSRPSGKTARKNITQKVIMGPPPVTPKIRKGWPTRASTEFTGWPSPSTTPFSIEKLLELQRNATSTTPLPEVSTETTTRRIFSTTTTTTVPPQPTTPGICRYECDIAGTIKIVSGVKWIPELLDQHTKEWQKLAKEIKNELNSVYSKSDLLSKWYKGIRIDGFSQGSVLVDYFIELNNVEEKVDTYQLKRLFHKSLNEAKAGSVVEEEIEDTFDPDAMVGDQPEEDRMKKSDEKMTKTIDKSAGKLEMGKFVMDPAYTEFIVLPKREEPVLVETEEESLLPQWGIAVIVIALASLLFVVIFGVTVLVNRQKSTKTKQPIPLSEDMLRELDKSHMGGFDDIHQLKERDLPYLPSGKRMSSAFIEQLAYQNPGDSWRSEWTPQAQKYMQHYAPDSGRGSQIYGTTGNGYGGGGSQLYGQSGVGAAGSQVYGYTGEFPRSHYSRRRSDYDSNF